MNSQDTGKALQNAYEEGFTDANVKKKEKPYSNDEMIKLYGYSDTRTLVNKLWDEIK